MIKKLRFPQQPEGGCLARAEGLRWLCWEINAFICLLAGVAMGMGGQALPGVNAEKLSAPLPCPALLCLGDWQLPPPAACSQHGAMRAASFSPGTAFPKPAISVSNPFSSSFPQHSVLP